MDKATEILAAAGALRAAFGSSIELVDDWPSDREALGVAKRGNRYPLLYFSSATPAPGTFALSLELPPDAESEAEYRDGGWLPDVAIDGLVAAAAAHLKLTRAPS